MSAAATLSITLGYAVLLGMAWFCIILYFIFIQGIKLMFSVGEKKK